MITFEVQDMTCGHCVSSITKAVLAINPGATVTTDLATQQVQIEPSQSDMAKLSCAIRGSGYTPEPIDSSVASTGGPASRSDCCCR